MHRAYVSQGLIQTMIHPCYGRVKVQQQQQQRQRRGLYARGRSGRQLQEWFESRPYTGGVVCPVDVCNYRKPASFCFLSTTNTPYVFSHLPRFTLFFPLTFLALRITGHEICIQKKREKERDCRDTNALYAVLKSADKIQISKHKNRE